MSLPEPAVVTAAFMGGLLGSGHCFAMCGGIAGSLGALAASPRRRGLGAAVQFNAGRLLGYTVLGASAGGLLGLAGGAGQVPGWGIALRGLTALLVLLIGTHYLFGWRGLRHIEQVGAALWRHILPVAARAASRPDLPGRLALGLAWGFLPCGLVYTILLMAAATGNALGGAVTMAAFGAGTLPAMLGLTVAAPSLAGLLSDRTFRRFIGLSLVLLAAWMAFSLWPDGTGTPHRH